jgi:hypothetical protein
VGPVRLTLRPEYYRQNALEFLRQANTTSDPRSKAMLIDMAVACRRLAAKSRQRLEETETAMQIPLLWHIPFSHFSLCFC